MTCDKEQIESFLSDFKQKMKERNGFTMVPRKKNSDDLKSLGIKTITVKGIINSLNFIHYYSGPEGDSKYPGNKLWVFGYVFNGKLLYIKLSDDLKYKAKCISFHKADFQMKFPYN